MNGMDCRNRCSGDNGDLMKRRFMVIAAITYFLLTLQILNIRYSPIILSPLITDIFTVFLASAIVISLTYLSFKIKTKLDILLLMPLAIILVFLVRALPNIILAYPPLSDPYYYFTCTTNVLDFGTLQSQIGWWYPQSTTQLNWPILEILTVQSITISGLDPMIYLRFLMPFIGIIFFLGIYTLTYDISKRYGVALLAALIAVLSSTTIFYQSEYHPQGLALTLFVFVLIGLFRSRSNNAIPFVLISLVFISAFTLSHHFSTLFLALICMLMIGLIVIGQKISFLQKWLSFLSSDITFLSIVVIMIFSFYIYTNPNLLHFFLDWSHDLNTVSKNTQTISEPLLTTGLNLAKWIPISIILLAVPSIMWHKRNELIRPLIILFLIIVVGSLGLFLFFLPLDRLLAFSMPIIGVICSIALFNLSTARSRLKRTLFQVSVVGISIAMVAGIFASQTPAYFFKSSEPNAYYLYNNSPSDAVETESLGLWLIEKIPENSTYGVTSATWAIPFFYGKNPDGNVKDIKNMDFYNYVIINHNSKFDMENQIVSIESGMNNVYSGPSVDIYSDGW
jgi:hypothetical protein